MGTPLLIQSAGTNVVIYLETVAGLPATGLTFSSVTAGLKKESQSSFASFTLSGGNFIELNNGFYEVILTSANTDTLGSLYISVVGATIKNALLVARVAVAATASPQPSPGYTPVVTTMFGYLYTPLGLPKSGATVVARLVSAPALIHPIDQGIVISADVELATTDASGFFSFDLLASATYEFIISSANFRRTILVPGTTQNIFDIV